MKIQSLSQPSVFYMVQGSHFKFSGQVMAPFIRNQTYGPLQFLESRQYKGRICKMAGTISQDVFIAGNIKLVRELFLSDKKEKAGIRLILSNLGNEPIYLDNLTPLSIREHQSIQVSSAYYDQWAVMRMSRHKNDIPGCFRPGIEDMDFKNASFQSAEIPAGLGVSAEDMKKFTKTSVPVLSEPGIFIKNRNQLNEPGLFIGVLGQDKHLSMIVLSGNSENKTQLGQLAVIYEFDGIRIDKGETVETHWVLFFEANEENKMLADFAELLGVKYQCPAPAANPPSIYCTWYFYASNFSELDLDENLKILKNSPVPFDVFLIDDGWADNWGSWQPNSKFPNGMKIITDKIKAAGFKPGIWTCPFVVKADSPILIKYPDLIAHDKNGNPFHFGSKEIQSYAVDPTSPHAEDYFNKLYSRLREWGFVFHKFDFLRSIIILPEICFFNTKVTRAQAYRMGLTMVRKAIGKNGYILACGGLFEGSIGIADGIRIGSDTRGFWGNSPYKATIKQTIFRAYYNRFFHTDPDAAMLRLKSEPFRNDQSVLGKISLGSFTDEEAFTIVANQYIGGGVTCFSERFAELQEDRKNLLRHIVPARFPLPKIMDIWNKGCPSMFLSEVIPDCNSLKPWWTLVVCNWENGTARKRISIGQLPISCSSKRFAVFEFKTQEFLGIFPKNKNIVFSVPSHGTRLLRIVPWNGKDPFILGTDLHITGGAVELKEVKIQKKKIQGKIHTLWNFPISITAGFPHEGTIKAKTIKIESKENKFEIKNY